ncbi:hypothetical protein CDD83_2529 [Cordyceps sp. RAO-2017]|nr:hypothetical protein CDD83_2529 [Cordyceps sp. RAO-2017]
MVRITLVSLLALAAAAVAAPSQAGGAAQNAAAAGAGNAGGNVAAGDDNSLGAGADVEGVEFTGNELEQLTGSNKARVLELEGLLAQGKVANPNAAKEQAQQIKNTLGN